MLLFWAVKGLCYMTAYDIVALFIPTYSITHSQHLHKTLGSFLKEAGKWAFCGGCCETGD